MSRNANKIAKDALIRRYGPMCFIEKLQLRIDPHRTYKSKAQMHRMKELTYHHIIEDSKGGKATVENGALLTKENHQWFHEQSDEARSYMNAVFQAYKKKVDDGEIDKDCKVVYVEDLDLPPYVVKPANFIVGTRKKSRNSPNCYDEPR